MTRIRLAAAAVSVTVLLAACAGGDDKKPAPSTGGDEPEVGLPGNSGTLAPAFDLPRTGECRGPITREIIEAISDPRPTVPCDGPHGSETYFVGELPTATAALSHREVDDLPDEFPERRQMIDMCEKENDRYVGVRTVGNDAIRPSNLSWAFFIPPPDDWEKGARWVRCDAVTKPLEGQAERSTTEGLQGIVARDPLPGSLRWCHPELTGFSFSSLVSCDQPHKVEVLLEFRVADPKIDALAADQEALAAYARTAYQQTCQGRVARQVGLSTADFMSRADINYASAAIDIEYWAADPTTRRAWCLAITERPVIGTVEALGTRPLPGS